MPVVSPSAQIEAWLDRSASEWELLSDRAYRNLVARWCDVFSIAANGPSAVRGERALAALEERLPASVLLFNGLEVPAAAVSGTPRPTAYRAVLLVLDRALANENDLIFVDQGFLFTCVCTHEWQALSRPLFVGHAA